MKSNIKQLHYYYFIVSFLFIVFAGLFVVPNAESMIDTAKEKNIYLTIGELDSLKVYSLTRISMVDPSIADITNATENEIELIGQKVGQTALFIWDQNGKKTIIVHVAEENLEISKERLQDLFDSAGINEVDMEINENEGKIILKGELPDDKKDAFDKIIDPFSQEIFNLVNKEKLKDMIQIDMEVVELNSSYEKALGIDWTSAGSTDNGITLSYPETMPSSDGSIADFFKIGQFNRNTALGFSVDALLKEGKGKILSKPKLLVTNGEQASFLVGGEIPIRTSTQSDGTTSNNVSFKQYGVSFGITPKIEKVEDEKTGVEKQKINVDMNIDISDIDESNKVGDDVAFSTRSVTTKLFLDNKQTIVLAGLIKTNEGKIMTKVPWLWRIPVVGLLFQKESMPAAEKQTELVISLTASILSKGKEVFNNGASLSGGTEGASSWKALKSKDLKIPEAPEVTHPTGSFPYDAQELSGVMKKYITQVQRLMAQSVEYPPEARAAGWEGALKLDLLILKDGTLAFVYVKEPSAYKIFDEYALRAANNITNYPKFPQDAHFQEVEVVVPIIYSLDNK